MELFKSQMENACNLGLHERTVILAGIIVPKSAMMLQYMDSSVAGVTVPKPLIDRMNKVKEAAGDVKKKMWEVQEQEGIKITVELIHQALEIPGIKGVHIQAIEVGDGHGVDRQGSRALPKTEHIFRITAYSP